MTILARCGALLLLLVACGAVPAHAAETMARASQLLGWGATDAGGKEIARIEDVLVDTASGRAVSLLLSVGDREYRQVALPIPIQGGARVNPQGGLVLESLTREDVVALPVSDKDTLAAQPALRPARDILRGGVVDKDGKKIGDVEDLVVRLDAPAPVVVAVKFDPSFHRSETLVGIALTGFEASATSLVARFDKSLQLPAPKVAAAPAPPPLPPLDPDARLTAILGAPVQASGGAAVGQVRDLAVDSSKREVTHVVVARAGGGAAAYPLSRLAVRIEGGKPVFTLQGDAADAVPVDANGLVPRRAPASRLLRSEIADSQGKKAGDVEDVVINLRNGRLHFAVAEFNPNWVAAGWMVAIPVRPLKPTGEGEHLAMTFDLNELNRAYLFQKGQWPDVNERQFRALIDRHLAASQRR